MRREIHLESSVSHWAVLNDLHLDRFDSIRDVEPFLPEADKTKGLILAGDIGVLKHPRKLTPKSPLVQLLVNLSKRFKALVMIFGNHEYYNAAVSEDSYYPMRLENLLRSLGVHNVHVLDDDTIYIKDNELRIIGSTLWTDVGGKPHHSHDLMRSNGRRSPYNDFNFIMHRSIDGKYRRLRPEDVVRMHHKSAQYLHSKLSDSFVGETWVVSHHLPSYQLLTQSDQKNPMNIMYASNKDDLLNKADVWFFGHSHQSIDKRVSFSNTRIISNAYGYHKKNHLKGNVVPQYNKELTVTPRVNFLQGK